MPDPREEGGSGYWLLALAGGSVLLSAVTIFLGDARATQLVGYLLAAPLPFTLVAFFRRHSSARLLSAGVGVPASVTSIAWLVLFAGFVSSIAHALLIARHYG